jgi:hypothetical protein
MASVTRSFPKLKGVNYYDNLIRDFRRRTVCNISSDCIFRGYAHEKITHLWPDDNLSSILYYIFI